MPSRVNGIGTAYVGQSNVERHQGVCEQCRREVVLTDYQTGLWFTVLFIPIVPLGKQQILGYCPACTRHRAVPLQEWNRIKEEAVSETVAELATNRDDPQAAMKTHATLAAFGKLDEAEATATMMESQFSEDIDVHLHLGAWREQLGQAAKADAHFERAFELDPSHPGAIRAVGIGHIEQGRLDQARQVLSALLPPSEAYDPTVFLMLGRAFQQAGDHAQAMDCFRSVLDATPGLAKDRGFRDLIRVSEKALGTGESIVRSDPFYRSGKFLLAIAACLVLAAVFVSNAYIARHRTLHVVNGLSVSLVLEVADHEAVTVPAGGSASMPIAEGLHMGQVTSPPGFGEPFQFELKAGWLGRFFSNPAFLLDPTQSAVTVWQETVYSEFPGDEKGDFRLHVGELLVSYDDVDYIMEDFPDQIQIEGSRSVTKTRVGLLDVPPQLVATVSPTPLSAEQELSFIERHLTASADEELLAYYVAVSHRNDDLASCQQFLGRGLQRKPLDVAWHRMYQTTSELVGEAEELPLQYDRLLQAAPNDSNLLYLRGRLEPVSSAASEYFDRALAADQGNGFAWAALSFGRLGQGDFGGAWDAIQRAAELQPNREELQVRQFSVLLALGDFQGLRQQLAETLRETPLDVGAHQQYLKVLTAAGDAAEADAAQERLKSAVNEFWPEEDPQHFALLSELLLHYLRGEFDEVISGSERLPQDEQKAYWQFHASMAQGNLADAVQQRSVMRSPGVGIPDLALSLAFRLQCDEQKANEWLDRSIALLSAAGSSNSYAAGLIERAKAQPVPYSEAIDISMEPVAKALVLVELARNATEDREAMLDLAGRLNFDLEPPGQFVRAAIQAWQEDQAGNSSVKPAPST